MPVLSKHPLKSKVTVSLDADLIKRLDKLVPKGHSRSQLVEKALRQWLKELTRYRIEEEVEQYYLSLSESEKEEDRMWDKISAESAENLWDKE